MASRMRRGISCAGGSAHEEVEPALSHVELAAQPALSHVELSLAAHPTRRCSHHAHTKPAQIAGATSETVRTIASRMAQEKLRSEPS